LQAFFFFPNGQCVSIKALQRRAICEQIAALRECEACSNALGPHMKYEVRSDVEEAYLRGVLHRTDNV
jgi:hypothetical protein